MAVAGPEALAGPLASRLASLAGAEAAGSRAGVLLLPSLLGRRESFLSRLRARLTRNRSAVASASVREAPWTMQWGGGWWAVLQINPDQDADELCLALARGGSGGGAGPRRRPSTPRLPDRLAPPPAGSVRRRTRTGRGAAAKADFASGTGVSVRVA